MGFSGQLLDITRMQLMLMVAQRKTLKVGIAVHKLARCNMADILWWWELFSGGSSLDIFRTRKAMCCSKLFNPVWSTLHAYVVLGALSVATVWRYAPLVEPRGGTMPGNRQHTWCSCLPFCITVGNRGQSAQSGRWFSPACAANVDRTTLRQLQRKVERVAADSDVDPSFIDLLVSFGH